MWNFKNKTNDTRGGKKLTDTEKRVAAGAEVEGIVGQGAGRGPRAVKRYKLPVIK